MNLDGDNVSYPILITIAADPQVNQNMNVTCFIALNQELANITFDITPLGYNVSIFVPS